MMIICTIIQISNNSHSHYKPSGNFCAIKLLNVDVLDCARKSQKAMLLRELVLELPLALLFVLSPKAAMLFSALNIGIKIYAHMLKACNCVLNILQ